MAELAPAGAPGLFRMGFAGDTFNTAWYLARIAPDVAVSYATALGDDAISRDMRSFMDQSGISTRHIQEVPGGTVGLYQIHIHEGERSFTYWRDSSAARRLARDAAALRAAMDAADVIYFSGITLAILDKSGRATLFEALDTARAAGKVIAFDPNLRPRLWPSTDEMTQTIETAAARAHIALPSFEDEAHWFGDKNAGATVARYLNLGADHVVVKNAGHPVDYASGGIRSQVAVPPIGTPVDSTAAGDSFNAGLLAGLIAGADIVTSIAQGCALAGRVVQHPGALVPV